jgi:hypothetical protein
LERYFGGLTAVRARNRIHFTSAAVTTTAAPTLTARGLAHGSAIGTAIGFVLKAFAGEKLLFSSGEDELRTAIGAG